MKGSEVRALRERAGLSPGLFAELVGASPSSVTRWEQAGEGPARMHPYQTRVITLLRQQLDERGDGPDGQLATSIREALIAAGSLRGLYRLLCAAFGPRGADGVR